MIRDEPQTDSITKAKCFSDFNPGEGLGPLPGLTDLNQNTNSLQA